MKDLEIYDLELINEGGNDGNLDALGLEFASATFGATAIVSIPLALTGVSAFNIGVILWKKIIKGKSGEFAVELIVLNLTKTQIRFSIFSMKY